MHFEIFQGIRNQWYWRLFSSDEQKIAFSSEGYEDKNSAIKNIEMIKALSLHASIKETN